MGIAGYSGAALNSGSFPYLTQFAYVVNSATGNDNNTGATAANALLTLRELARRVNYHFSLQNVTVTLSGAFTDSLFLELSGLSGTLLDIVCDAPTVNAVGSLTAAFQALTVAGNLDAEVTDAAQVWAPLIGKQIVMTSGAAVNGIAVLLKDLGANKVRVSQFVNPSTGNVVTPANGDTYQVRTPVTRFAGFRVRLAGGMKFRCTSFVCHVEDADHLGQYIVASNILPTTTDQSPQAKLVGGKFENAVIAANQAQSFTQSHFGMFGCWNEAQMRLYHSRVVLNGHAMRAQNIGLNAGSRIDIQAGLVGQGAGMVAFEMSAIQLTIDGANVPAPLAIYDTAGTTCLDLDVGTVLSSVLAGNTLMGTGNTSASSARVRTGGGLYYLTQPVIAGPAVDVVIGGTNTAWAATAVGVTVNGATVAPRA